MEYFRNSFALRKIFKYDGLWCLHRLQSKEMNIFTLLLVFLCGVLFTVLISLCKNVLQDLHFSYTTKSTGLGVLPPDTDLSLMDDGYIAMALLGSKYTEYISGEVSEKHSTDLEKKGTETEALNTLRAAEELVASGKMRRAGRLLEHAHSLAPRHPEILVSYGEFIEANKNDVVHADYLYLKALAISPDNARAIRNRKRTLQLVEKLDAELLLRVEEKRNSLGLIPASSAALRRIQKEAYIHHIYHTAGIEGNTLSLAETRTILETGLGVGGKNLVEQNEILGLDLALKYINGTLVHRVGKIQLMDILEIHRRVLGHADPIEAGRLRTTQVFVSDHIPPPPTNLELLMEEFLEWLNSRGAQQLHPVRYAALAHYKFVFIHPFVDGNGRTARLLMNFLLMQAGYPPIIIRKQDRLKYYQHLQTANDGDTRPFVRFITHCTEKTLEVYLWATKEQFPELESSSVNDQKDSVKARGADKENKHHSLPNENFKSKTKYENGPLWLSEHEDESYQTKTDRFQRVIRESDILKFKTNSVSLKEL